jgi:hypothetical protein
MSGLPVRERKRDKLRKRFGFGRAATSNSPQSPNAGASDTLAVHPPTLLSPDNTGTTAVPCMPSVSSGRATPTASTPTPSQATPASLVTTPARDLWFDALQTLSDGEREAIQNIQPAWDAQRPFSEQVRELVSTTRMIQNECERGSIKIHFQGREIILRDVVEKIVVWLDKFKAIGDVAANADPLHAGLPWAGVRFLLQVI